MNQTVKRIVDILFQDTVENDETRALHEELMNNCQEHYQDLVSRGLSEDEAIGEVVDSLKGMKDVIAQYPKKTGGTAPIQEEEAGAEWHFSGADCLKADTMDQDLYVSPSADGNIHVYCDSAEGVTAEQKGGTVEIRGEHKLKKVGAAFEMKDGEEITLNGILNMVGKAIRNVSDVFRAMPPIRIGGRPNRAAAPRTDARFSTPRCPYSCARASTTSTPRASATCGARRRLRASPTAPCS